jgi:hypothetical protein
MEKSILGNCSAQTDVSCAKFSEVPRQFLLDAWLHCARVILKPYNNKRRQQRTHEIIPEYQ